MQLLVKACETAFVLSNTVKQDVFFNHIRETPWLVILTGETSCLLNQSARRRIPFIFHLLISPA